MSTYQKFRGYYLSHVLQFKDEEGNPLPSTRVEENVSYMLSVIGFVKQFCDENKVSIDELVNSIIEEDKLLGNDQKEK